MDPKANANFDAHEEVAFFTDEATGLAAIIAVHSTALGPSAGGCRYTTYSSPEAALTDALRLSRGMSLKNAMADLPMGGGKAVVYAPAKPADRTALFEAFGAAVETLNGRYVTAEDVGVTVADMQAISHRTRHVAGLPPAPGMAGGDPSPWTALGVFLSIEAAIGRPLAGSRVAVQGLGAVGSKVARLLHQAGARLVVADIDAGRLAAAVSEFGAMAADVATIHTVEADLFSPNALGAVLNAQSIPNLGAPVVCGGANNQLAVPQDGVRLRDQGVLYAPDYVVNGGGIINVAAEYLKEPAASVETRVRQIPGRVRLILDVARAEGKATSEIADRMAFEKIGRGAKRAA